MSISFACKCGRRYKVEDRLAGKSVKCKQCGGPLRIPDPSPEADAYGLDDGPIPLSAEPTLERIAARGDGPQGAKRSGKGSKSRWEKALRGFQESIPRGNDLAFPIFGAVALAVTVISTVTGGLLLLVMLLFDGLAAFVCSIWAGVSALVTANRQGSGAVLAILPALVATFFFFLTILAPNPFLKATLAGATSAVFYAGFFYQARRGEEYRKPIALGSMAALLVVSFAVTITAAIGILNRPAITPEALRQARSQGGSGDAVAQALERKAPLPEARRGFQSKPSARPSPKSPLDNPPPNVFRTVQYDSPVGKLSAYLSPDPGDGSKHPAIIWITGGDCNSIGDVWTPMDPQNDQTAAAFRQSGIVMMFPSLRGGNDNPGKKEGFLGEVDDVLAAADFLASQDFVEPSRIYLGGHSTGGTLVLLVAESTDRFRAVFSFGPVNDVRGYPSEFTPFPTSDVREVVVRSPGYWLHSIRCPTFVIEGESGNIGPLRAMEKESKNPLAHFLSVKGADHFSVLAPVNRIIAAKILRDQGPRTDIQISPQELSQPFGG